jgi:RNA polymerase sigma-70 factor (ECF subfamily)
LYRKAYSKKEHLNLKDINIEAIIKGDQKAFATLYNEYSSLVYNTALSYTKIVQDAEEITQEVFVKIFRKASTFKGDSKLSTWIYRIAINTSLNHIKKNKKRSIFGGEAKENQAVDFVHPGVLMENKENTSALFKAMDCLPETQKTAFILSYIEELPRQEVANVMETSLKAVESLLQRAKRKMREELIKTYPNRGKKK